MGHQCAAKKVGIDIDGILPMSLSDPSATGALPDGMEDAPLILETSMEQFPTLFSCRLGKWIHHRIPEPAPFHWNQLASWLFTCLGPFGSGWYDFSPSRKLLITGLRDLWADWEIRQNDPSRPLDVRNRHEEPAVILCRVLILSRLRQPNPTIWTVMV
ncbi:hypothetical protein BDP81DRAFT_414248 [Colletotrichum phormii]|uniref:Uncharacterized protein n=1 Tax=Colletotrichum phormii TaxID=359342 RepID=A0AAJ0A455_9PEZI|nr:uncharacterized protein BDP81DRAFT_414248 [Colletotrichum phormii]KAK1656143.1 hypothetical protein BDP81DRAFT_414248 [Colletotrichum phormii]